MALWFPIMVNDNRIGHVYIHRIEELEDGRDEYMYEWEVRHRPFGEGIERVSVGTTKHNYSAGALSLIAKVLGQQAQVRFVS